MASGTAERFTDSNGSGPDPAPMRGTMLWFNESDDFGALETDDGQRLDVPGSAFAPGHKPVGRCAGKPIEFETGDDVVTKVTLVAEVAPRRARACGTTDREG